LEAYTGYYCNILVGHRKQDFKEQFWADIACPYCPGMYGPGTLLISGEKMEEVVTLFCQKDAKEAVSKVKFIKPNKIGFLRNL